MKYIYTLLLTTLLITGCGSSSDPETQTLNDLNLINVESPYGKEDIYSKYQWEHTINFSPDLYYINSNAGSNINEAWQYGYGANNVTIAVIDTCFDLSLEDSPKNIVATYNMENNGPDISCKPGDSAHGSFVLGVLGAPINGKGIIGVAPNANYILIKLPTGGYLTENQLINAFTFAYNNGAKVISNSWGTKSLGTPLNDLFKELYNRGVIILFSSGNDNISLDTANITDESESPYVLGIGASSEINTRANYSNYGSNIDFLAPAGDYGILTTDFTYGSDLSSDSLDLVSDKYSFFAGTSAAAPLAAGIVSLIVENHMGLNMAQVKDILKSSTQKIGGVVYTNGWNDEYSYGKIDAFEALNVTNSSY